MRVAFIEPHLKCVGGIRRIVETTNRLIKFGHTVEIFTPTGKPCGWLECKALVQPLKALKNNEYDVVLFNLAEQYKIMQEAKAKLKVFWVLAPEALYKDPKAPIEALKQDFYLIANSKFTVNYVHQHTSYAKTIPIIAGGINKDHFRHDPEIQKQYDILYYGSARPWKGAQVVQAMLAFQNSIRNKILSTMKMEGKNTPQHEMYRLYNSAKIYVSANLVEGFSFGQLEAMACGCAVVTTDDGGSRDYVKNNYNAMVCPRNPMHMHQTVLHVLQNKDLYRTLVKNGLKTAAEPRFDWDTCTRQLEKVFKDQLKI
jgi:glycosyltransferase involved in cell wall biosynthesis